MAFYNDISDPQNIVISFTSTPTYDFGVFAKGYHHAANSLAEKFLATSHHRDYEGYPIVFLYRHAFELNLKNIVCWAARLCAFRDIESMNAKLIHNHNLVELSKKSTMMLRGLFPTDKKLAELMKKVEIIATEFHEIDSNSHSYRYPINKIGEYSTKHHQIVNISSIYTNMNKLLKDLEVVNFGLDLETSITEDAIDILNSFVTG
jgi:hypothetical protein